MDGDIAASSILIEPVLP
jgi:hypothetical protein